MSICDEENAKKAGPDSHPWPGLFIVLLARPTKKQAFTFS
jgi:hypothetical protein